MGHIGEEIILGTVGLFRHLLSHPQFFTFSGLFLRTEQIEYADSEKYQKQTKHPKNQHKNIRNAFRNDFSGHYTYNKKFCLPDLCRKNKVIP